MSRTNVHSEKNENAYCAAAQIIPTERDVEIPPKSFNMGPSKREVIFGETMEIPAENSELHKDGKLFGKDGKMVGQFSDKAYNEIKSRNAKRTKNKRVSKASKEEGR